MFSCKGEEGNIGMGGRGGRGGRGWGEGGSGRILVFPAHRQPKSIGGGETSPPDLGAHLWVHTEGTPHNGNFEGWGSMARGLEGIRIGTSDRFGRGRGE